MKLGMHEHTDISAGVMEEVAISFEANAVAFYAQISGLAKDKIGYPIRELSTNAWDASRGRMEVHLPTSLNPVFRVRDFGPGMSADDMVNVYARLYASTKRGTNESVGGWGLGSKSPFAYLIGDNGAGSYNVTSYHGGMMRSYVLSLSTAGAPVMRKLAEMPSDEPTGMDVSFPVRREDIHRFHDRARSILWSFNPRPTISPDINWAEPVVLSSGENWTSYKVRSVPFFGPTVRMGCVSYPFDLSQIKNTGFLDENDAVLFEAPIGSLKVTLSREELAYDDRTKATLTALVREYENSFISQLRQKVDAATNLFEACKAFDEGVTGFGQTREERLRAIITWRNLPLTHSITKVGFKTCMLANGWQRFDKFEDSTVRSTWATDAKIVIEHNPNYSLSRFAMAELVGEKVLWVRCKRVDREATLRQLGLSEADVITLDNFKVPVEKRISKTIRKRRTIDVVDRGRMHRVTQDVDMADGGFYVEQAPVLGWRRRRGSDFFRVNDAGHGIAFHDLERVIDVCLDFDIIEKGTVILIKNYDQEVGDNWTLLGNEIIDQLKAKVDVSQIDSLHKKTINNLNHRLHSLSKWDVFRKAPEDLREFKRDLTSLVAKLKGNVAPETDSDKACSALSKLGIEIEKPTVACPIAAIDERYQQLCVKYPLLQMILNSSGHYSYENRQTVAQMRHYLSLLARPEALEIEEEDLDDEELEEAA